VVRADVEEEVVEEEWATYDAAHPSSRAKFDAVIAS
jgi:hypothetical protein